MGRGNTLQLLTGDYSEAVVYQKKDELDFESLQADFYMENGRYEGQIIGSFKSEEELTKCCEELLDVKNQLEKLGFENLQFPMISYMNILIVLLENMRILPEIP